MAKVGLTIVEFIAVMIIVLLLAMIVVPGYFYNTKNARNAALNSLANTINTLTQLAQAEYRDEGNASDSQVTGITMHDAVSVVVEAGIGKPTATAAGIGAALGHLTNFAVNYNGKIATFTLLSHPVKQCNFVYNQATGVAIATTIGC